MKTELYHHGVKGQKWGVRHYQNPDGTLTPAGRKRYLKLTRPSSTFADQELKKIGMADNVIKKGQTITRATVKGEELSNRRIYAAILESDIEQYGWDVENGTLGRFTNVNAEDAYQITYEALKDLKVATVDDQLEFYIKENADKTLKEFSSKNPEVKKEYNELIEQYGNTPIGNFIEDIKLTAKRNPFPVPGEEKRQLSDTDKAILNNPARSVEYLARHVMEDDIIGNTSERDDYFSKKHEELLTRMGKAGFDAFVDIEDQDYSTFPLIITKPDTKLKVQSKINFRQKKDEEDLDIWRRYPNEIKRRFKDKRLRGGTLTTMGNVWYKMTDAEKKEMTKPIPRKWKKWIPVMDQFTDYKKEHPNSDMQFNDYVAMIQKSKESKK